MMSAHSANGGNRAALTACVIVATLMQALDTTIANVALPYMQGSVSASQDQIDWVLTSYIAVAAIMTPPTGFLTARFGLKRVFLVSIGGFTLASMLCGMAPCSAAGSPRTTAGAMSSISICRSVSSICWP